MSALGGIFYFDGRPVPPAVVGTLAAGCERFAPDGGIDVFPSPGVVIVHRSLQVTLEDRADRQPIQVANGNWLTWDGRLDNRSDLMMELHVRPSVAVPDAEVAAEACRRWEDDAYERLIGDWSLALWNPARRAVTLASDFMGVRPLFYAITDAYCIWCSALEPIVAICDKHEELDDDYLQAKLIGCFLPGRTAYRGISSLFGGHFLTVSPTGVHGPRQFWHLPAEQLRYHDPRDYQIHLRTVFKQAVADRLRSNRPVWMHLSGGLDSSSIVCMAAHLAQEGVVSPRALATLSYVTPTAPESDETRFIETVEAFTGLDATHVALDHAAPPTFPSPAHMRDINPGFSNAYEQMRHAGARVLLTGRLGDNVMGNSRTDLTETVSALRRVRPLALLRSLRDWSLVSQRTAWSLLASASAELMPTRIRAWHTYRQAVQTLRKGAPSSGTAVEIILVNPAALSLLRSTLERYVAWSKSEGQAWMNNELVMCIGRYLATRPLMSPPESTCVAHTHPFADRRLIEFVSRIDWLVMCRPGRPRALMHDALGPMLPERIARRFSKGYVAPYVARKASVAALALAEQLDTLQVVRRGYVDPRKLRTSLELSAAGPSVTTSRLVEIGSLESWLRLGARLNEHLSEHTTKGGDKPWNTALQ